MQLATRDTRISAEEYLEAEKTSLEKHEYVDGKVYAMAGAGDNHGNLVAELLTNLVVHLRSSKCETFASDMKVRATENVFYYPDVLVSCEENPDDAYFRNRPILIIEVTSPSTERIDRAEKLFYYLQIPSLLEYVIVAQRAMSVEVHRRQPNGGWAIHYYAGGEDAVELSSVDLTIPLSELYRRVRFENNANRAE